MANLLLLCAGERDLREIAVAGISAEHSIFRHDYATDALEALVSSGAQDEPGLPIRDPRAELEEIVATYRGRGIDGVISTDDYPGSTLACLVAGSSPAGRRSGRRSDLPAQIFLPLRAGGVGVRCRSVVHAHR